MGRILLILLALLIAWNFSEAGLAAAFGFFPALFDFLSIFSINGPDRSGLFYVRFIFAAAAWWCILWLTMKIFKGVGVVLFGYAFPTAQRFGTTKRLRRLQWLTYEAVFSWPLLFVPLDILDAKNRNQDYGVGRFIGALLGMVIFLVVMRVGEKMFRTFLIGVWIPWMRFLERGRFGIGGSGRFIGMIEEWGYEWSITENYGTKSKEEKALFMGRSLYSPFTHVGIEDDRHMITIAGSRSGKGSTVIIPNLLHWRGSVIVIDPKGTSAHVTANRRRQMGQDVHIIDPFGIVTDKGAGFNPLAALDLNSKTLWEDIGVIADALVVMNKEAKDPHWDEGGKSIIAGFIEQALTDPAYRKHEVASLVDVRDMLLLPDKAPLWVAMKYNTKGPGWARQAGIRVSEGAGTQEVKNLISNAHKHMEWLSSHAMMWTLFRDQVDFLAVKSKPTTIYVVIPPEYVERHSRFLRLVINTAIMKIPVGGKSKIPVLMMIDEFHTLGHMEEVQKAFRLLAGYNFTLWPFVQDYASLQELYPNGVNAFITNSRAVQVFAVDDPQTCEFVSKKLGQRSLEFVMGKDSLRNTPLRDTAEVAKEIERGSGMQYVIPTGGSAILLERVKYFEGGTQWPALHPFAALYSSDPDYT